MSKKVSIKEVKDFVNATDIYEVPISLSIGEKTISIVFQPYLSLSEESDFVNEMVSYVFDKNGEYHSECIDIAFTSMVLKYLSNITLPTLKSNKSKVNLDIIKDWDNSVHFIQKIKSIPKDTLIGKNFIEYIDYLNNISNLKIDYIKNKSKSDVLFETITDVVKKYDGKMNDIDIKDAVNKSVEVFNKVKSMDEGKFATAIVDHAKDKESKDNITKISDVKQ